ncbi:MAG: hypothetical protein K2Y39_08035 [Candidatus Obscuribacterales bacterium]|nr:hypothetical protein [Candidatus Obscuribacterales bacterium]
MRQFLPIAIFLIAIFAGSPAIAQDRVQCNVSVDIPSVVRLTGVDNLTTTQSLSLDQSNISFDTELNARGSVSVMWKGNTNANNGFQITIQRSTITGDASPELQADLTVSGTPASGGDTEVVMEGAYSQGVKLPDIPEGKPAVFCATQKPGTANFNVHLNLDAPAAHGKGRVSTVLTFCAASL